MQCTSQLRPAVLAVAVAFLFSVISLSSLAAQPHLYVEVSDTTIQAGSDEAWVSVYLANYADTLAGFTLRIMADRPGLIAFRTDNPDTLYTPGGVDTAGTAISGWQYVGARSFSQNRSDIKVTALANLAGPPHVPGLPPRGQPVLLLRLNIEAIDSLPFATDSIVNLIIVDNLFETGFSDPEGNLIGTETHYNICDTTYWKCLDWSGDTCLAWAPAEPYEADSVRIDTFYTYWCCQEWAGDSCLSWEVCQPPGDSVSLDSSLWLSLDTNAVEYVNSTVTIVPAYPDSCCMVPGDANDDGTFNVGDPVYLINYIFHGAPAPLCPHAADVNGDCALDVSDVIRMIRPLFQIYPWEPMQCAPAICIYGD